MSSSQSVNVGGVIRALANLGFNPKDLVAEGIDNSLGVNSSHIKIIIDADKNSIFVDNGPGMNRTQLVKRFRLYDDSAASDNCQGRFGIGEDAKHALLSESKKTTKTITNGLVLSKTGPATHTLSLSEIELDWPTAVERSEFQLHAHDASRKSEDVWKKYAIDSTKSGTVDIIPLSESMFKYFTENTKEIVTHFERMYAENLTKGLHLEFHILDTVHVCKPKEVLQDETENGKTITHSKELRVYKKEDNTLRVCFRDSKRQWVYKDAKNHHASADELEKQGFAFVGSLLVDYAFHENWTKENGGVYYKRNNKILQQKKLPPLLGGDYGRQNVEVSSRQLVTFNIKFDSLFGLEVNKSHIDKIHPQLEAEINAISHDFSNKTWNSIKKQQPANPLVNPSPNPDTKNPIITPSPVENKDNTLDTIFKITPKPKPEAPAPAPAPAPTPAPTLVLKHPEFMKKYLDELVKVYPDWQQKKRLSTVAELWNTYKTSGVLPIITPPQTQIAPPAPPPPSTIQFSKNTNDSTLTITEGETVLFTLYYVGQAHIWENNLKQVLDAVGAERFKEYVRQLVVLNSTHLK